METREDSMFLTPSFTVGPMDGLGGGRYVVNIRILAARMVVSTGVTTVLSSCSEQEYDGVTLRYSWGSLGAHGMVSTTKGHLSNII
jgi:hypothetical protein